MKKKYYSFEIGMMIYQMVEVEAEDLEEAKERAAAVAATELGVSTPNVKDCYFSEPDIEEVEE